MDFDVPSSIYDTFFIFFRTINHPKQKIQKEAEESCFYQLSLYNKKEDHTISMKRNESFV